MNLAQNRLTIAHWGAVGSLLALIALSLCWELWLAPLRPDGSFWVLKVLPLLIPLRGLLIRRRYTFQWASLFVWLYFIEGVVRGYSEQGLSSALAGIEITLTVIFFVCCAVYAKFAAPSRLTAQQNA